MSTSEELLNNFMHNKNKEYLGEKVEKMEKNDDDNFLDENQKAMNTFSGDSAISDDDKGEAIIRKTINTLVSSLILVCGLASAFYIISKIMPSVLQFIKRLMIGFFI